MNKALIFPGQGSQITGMGKDFYDNFKVAKEIFELVDDSLQQKLSYIIFDPQNSDALTLTKNAQPALMAVSMAILEVVKTELNTNVKSLCSYVAGHSLGEYSALCAAGSFDIATVSKLLKVRGSSMQQACPENVGSMAACIGIDINKLEEIIAELSRSKHQGENFGVCQIANDNIIGQIVISGHTQAVERVASIVKDLGHRAIKLKVSAPFHCQLMQPAEQQMAEALESIKILPPDLPIIQNINASSVIDTKEIKLNLISQICGRVRWRETIEQLAKLGVEEIIEIGAGSVLTNMIRKTDHRFKLTNISNISELESFCLINK